MHQVLRQATQAEHEALDASFGALDLTSSAGYTRFLAAHLIGTRTLDAVFRTFAKERLGIDPPSYPDMLANDLAALRIDAAGLPAIEQAGPSEPAGITYVISGSRLGLAMIRKQDYWGKQAGIANSYMEDADGLSVWRGLMGWMGGQTSDPTAVNAVVASARHAFQVFGRAFALSADVSPR